MKHPSAGWVGRLGATLCAAAASLFACAGPSPALTATPALPPRPPSSLPAATQAAAQAPAAAAPAATPAITSVVIDTPSLAPFERFEAHFGISTASTRLDMPYDPSPPSGLPAGAGISVDVLFSPDNWTTVITQPAFLEQPYTHTVLSSRDHFVPAGKPRWSVRFAPQQRGAWQFRIRAQDATGVTLYPPSGSLAFTVAGASADGYRRRGFLRVSQADPRYFEFQDGSPFIGAGYNTSWFFTNAGAVEQRMALYEQYQMNFIRVWMSGFGINGSQWSPWGWPNQWSDGYLPATNLETRDTFGGGDVALNLDLSIRCYFTDFWQGGIPATPNTPYSLTARVKLNGVTGPAAAGQPYGFIIKKGGWPDDTCSGGQAITGYQAGSSGWVTLTGSYTTGGEEYWLDYLYFALDNVAAGAVLIDDARVWRADDPARINLLRKPSASSHLDFDPMNAAKADLMIEAAERHGVYLKIVVDEKNEWIRNHIDWSGAITGTADNNSFYAAPKVRWLAQAWWRYLIARWGYSPAIHSFEYVNEGDPYNGLHYDAANAMARYIHRYDPSRHLVTTSLWHSYPNLEFWQNAAYPDIDYVDLHAYISTGWGNDASFIDASRAETRTQYVRTGNASLRLPAADAGQFGIAPRGMVIRGPGEWIIRYWMKAQNFAAQCPFGSTGGMQRVRWVMDGGSYWGGREGVVPPSSSGLDYICTSPAGTFNWSQFRSDRDRDGQVVSAQYRLVLTDSLPHGLALNVENANGAGGAAWIDDVELVSPAGEVVPVIGQFDITPFDADTAWYNRAYGDLWGQRSPVGAHKPLVRGETGVDTVAQQDWQRALNNDTLGVWLHNNVWGQINPGGMYDLMWWSNETIDQNPATGRYTRIYTPYLTYRNFMADIPLNNGNYRDARAQTSSSDLRAWVQRDDTHGRIHLWVQNVQHTWKRVVDGPPIAPLSGAVTLAGVPAGAYQVNWWSTYASAQPIFQSRLVTVTAAGQLILPLPAPLADDVAVKIDRVVRLAPVAYLDVVIR